MEIESHGCRQASRGLPCTRLNSHLPLITSVKRRSSSVLAPLVSTSHSRIEQNLNIAPGHDIAQDFFDHGIDATMYVSSGGVICLLSHQLPGIRDRRLMWSQLKQW